MRIKKNITEPKPVSTYIDVRSHRFLTSYFLTELNATLKRSKNISGENPVSDDFE